MPALIIPEQQRRTEIARAERSEELDRRIRREWLVLLLLIVGWSLAGIVLVGLGMASPSPERGNQIAVAGLFLGNGGALVSVCFRVLRMVERGEL